jgi:hypothetical protein
MASLLSPRRSDPAIALHAAEARTEVLSLDGALTELPRQIWWVAAVAGAWLTALSGWIVATGLTVLGWLATEVGTLSGAMDTGSRLWLLTNGAGARLGSTPVTLVPWGATLGTAYLISRLAGFAASHTRGTPGRGVAAVSAVMTLAYAAPVALAALVTGGSQPSLRGLVPMAAVLLLAAAWGSSRRLAWQPTQSWPDWCRQLPRAVLGAQLVMVAAGVAALVAGMVTHLDRVAALTQALHAGVLGSVLLWLAQLTFLPNVVVWAASYILGAGFSLGQGSVVSLTSSEHGLLPSVPLLGALPTAGAGSSAQLWWLAAGVLAGGLAGWLALRGRPAARFDQTALVGGFAGLLAGLVFVAVAWASGGDLGGARLAGLGPRLLPLLTLAGTTLGLAGMLVGLVRGLLHRPSS